MTIIIKNFVGSEIARLEVFPDRNLTKELIRVLTETGTELDEGDTVTFQRYY